MVLGRRGMRGDRLRRLVEELNMCVFRFISLMFLYYTHCEESESDDRGEKGL